MAIRQGGLYRRPAPDKPAELVHRTKPAPAEIPAPAPQASSGASEPAATGKSKKKGG